MYFFTAPHATDDGEPQWFGYCTSDKLSFRSDDLLRTRGRLVQVIERLRARHRRRGGTVSLGGYSQGACMAIDVAVSMEVPVKVLVCSGFAMLPRFVSSPTGWHGYAASTLTKAHALVVSVKNRPLAPGERLSCSGGHVPAVNAPSRRPQSGALRHYVTQSRFRAVPRDLQPVRRRRSPTPGFAGVQRRASPAPEPKPPW